MPGALDLSKETDETLGLYGLKRGQSDGFGWQCLVARRLVERGVRFVELIHTGSSGLGGGAAGRLAGDQCSDGGAKLGRRERLHEDAVDAHLLAE